MYSTNERFFWRKKRTPVQQNSRSDSTETSSQNSVTTEERETSTSITKSTTGLSIRVPQSQDPPTSHSKKNRTVETELTHLLLTVTVSFCSFSPSPSSSPSLFPFLCTSSLMFLSSFFRIPPYQPDPPSASCFRNSLHASQCTPDHITFSPGQCASVLQSLLSCKIPQASLCH